MYIMPLASSSSTCIMSPEGPETLISIRSRYRVHHVLIIHVLTPTIYVLWQIVETFFV